MEITYTHQTERLSLRNFYDEDQEAIFNIAIQPGFHFFRLLSVNRFNPKLMRFATNDDVNNSSSELVKHCQQKSILGQSGLPEEMKMAICLKDQPQDKEVIGYISLGALLDPKRDIGYFIDPRHQGKGYAVEAAKGIISLFYQNTEMYPHLFENDPLDIDATVHPENNASIHVLETSHFRYTGKNIMTDVQGVQEPRLCYKLTKQDFYRGKMPIINGINVDESQSPVQLADFQPVPRLFLNTRFTNEFQIRPIIIDKINQALELLPNDKALMIFEAYRPRSRQLVLWNNIITQLKDENPNIAEDDLVIKAENFVSNPYKFGSGHQAAAAIDITLCELGGTELDMGTAVQEFNPQTETSCDSLSDEIKQRRLLLKSVLEQVGMINYPSEWWHYSYGDRLWAEVANRDFAFFAPIN